MLEAENTRLMLVGELPAMMALAAEMVHDTDGDISVSTTDCGLLSERCVLRGKVAIVDVKVNMPSLVRRLRGESAEAMNPSAAIEKLVGQSVEEVERALILQTLQHCGGNRTAAASILGISVRTMRNKLRAFLAEDISASPAILRT